VFKTLLCRRLSLGNPLARARLLGSFKEEQCMPDSIAFISSMGLWEVPLDEDFT
jgi:hypothetical protein